MQGFLIFQFRCFLSLLSKNQVIKQQPSIRRVYLRMRQILLAVFIKLWKFQYLIAFDVSDFRKESPHFPPIDRRKFHHRRTFVFIHVVFSFILLVLFPVFPVLQLFQQSCLSVFGFFYCFLF